jgi:hypothetical protein
VRVQGSEPEACTAALAQALHRLVVSGSHGAGGKHPSTILRATSQFLFTCRRSVYQLSAEDKLHVCKTDVVAGYLACPGGRPSNALCMNSRLKGDCCCVKLRHAT